MDVKVTLGELLVEKRKTLVAAKEKATTPEEQELFLHGIDSLSLIIDCCGDMPCQNGLDCIQTMSMFKNAFSHVEEALRAIS